jgi:hypothetical protein
MFELPANTLVNRNIPKNTFENFANSKQKKVLTTVVSKIRWLNKLSSKTINLDGKDIKEIQLFELSLKQKESISEITNLVDRVIPYNIIFLIRFENEIRISASQKHKHPTNEDQAVVDWTFTSDWGNSESSQFRLNLQQNLDFVFSDICFQISGKQSAAQTDIKTLIAFEQRKKQLTDQIQKLESAIKTCKQFNKKVELNLELQECKSNLSKNVR